jgi:excisionase family DNA binding protein
VTRNDLASAPTKASTPAIDLTAVERLAAAIEGWNKTAEGPAIDPELICLTPEQAATVLGVTTNWVVERITARAIPFTFVGRFPRLQARHIRAITTANEIDPAKQGRKQTAA